MIYITAILFGIVQGITEFLPISSSGHLLLMHKFFNLPISNQTAFDVAMHLATLLAVVICFWTEISLLAKSFIASLAGKKDEYSKTAWLIVFATIPAAVAGYYLDEILEERLRGADDIGMVVVAFMLVLVAILFLWVEKQVTGEKKFSSLNIKESMMIGFAQALALIPGTSRSGITIIAGLRSGLKREEALKFSFLLSIPIILGASVMKVPALFESGIESTELNILIIAFVSSFIAGILAVKYFLKYARNNSLNIFAYYRIALALLLVLYLLFK